ncbi:MAG: uroporphyrinogen-III synthase [Pseudomonadota bacterium]
MTRPRAASQALAARLDLARLCPDLELVISPVLRVERRQAEIPDAPAGLIFSSVNGVMQAAAGDLSRSLPVYTVGETTAQAARDAGWSAETLGRTADELVARLPDRAPATPLLHLHGVETRGDIARRLSEAGLPTESRVIYAQVPEPLSRAAHSALSGSCPVILPIFSPFSARALLQGQIFAAPLHVIALSDAVAEAFHDIDMHSLHVCDNPTREAMETALRATIRQFCRVERRLGED